jgi:L-iditol 2-dehydrogenase
LLAGILVRPGTIELREGDTPKPSHGEVLVKIKTALTCGTDLKAFIRGHPVIPMPGVFGHEFSGIIEDTGKGVKGFRKADEVMAVHSAPCLKCGYCKKKLYTLCENIMDSKILGAFAEFILLPSHIVKQNLFHKPEHLSFAEAAFLEPLSCVVHGITSLDIKKGDYALVIGAGPIGLLHLLLLKEKGAKVAVMDKNIKKLQIAGKLGADYTVVSNPPLPPFTKGGKLEGLRKESGVRTVAKRSDMKREFRALHFGKGGQGGISLSGDFPGFDYVFECTGMPEVWEASVNYVRRGGTVTLFGGCRSGATVTYDAGRLHYDEITLRGVFHYTPSDVRKAYELLHRKKIDVSPLISGKFPLGKTQKAFERLAKGRGIKYAIIP